MKNIQKKNDYYVTYTAQNYKCLNKYYHCSFTEKKIVFKNNE